MYEAHVSVPWLSTAFGTALHVQVHALEGEHRLAKLASCLLSFWTSWLPLVAVLTFRLKGLQRLSFVQWTGANFSTIGSQDRWNQQCGLATVLLDEQRLAVCSQQGSWATVGPFAFLAKSCNMGEVYGLHGWFWSMCGWLVCHCPAECTKSSLPGIPLHHTFVSNRLQGWHLSSLCLLSVSFCKARHSCEGRWDREAGHKG